MNSSTLLQRRHFEFIARVLQSADYTDTPDTIARRFADELEHTNPQFDRERFLKACGVTP